jgi:hypothetical protein
VATTEGPGKMVRGRGGRDRHQWTAGVDRGQAIWRWRRNRRIGLWRAWTRPRRGREVAAPAAHGGAQQKDAARHPEVGASEPTNWKGHWLGETEAARGELLHTTQEGYWLGETEAARGELLHTTQEGHWLGETEAAQGELLHATQEGHWLGETEAAQGELLHTTQEGHWLGETEAALGGLLHAAPKPGEKAGQPRPRGESYEAPGEQMPQGGEHTGSPRVGGSNCSGARHQRGSATESLTDTTGCHLVPIYQVIGLSVTVALLILLLVSILRMALDIMGRAIAIARARSCGWWLMGAFWGILLQVAVAPVQWAVAKRRAISKAAAWRGSTEAERLQAEDAKARRPGSEDVDRHSALGTGPSIADGLGSGATSSSARGAPTRSTWSPPSRASKPPWGPRRPVGTRRTRRTEGDQLLQERGC